MDGSDIPKIYANLDILAEDRRQGLLNIKEKILHGPKLNGTNILRKITIYYIKFVKMFDNVYSRYI